MDMITLERVEKLHKFYHSEFVAYNMPYILEIPFEDFVKRELAKTFDDYRNM